MNHKFSFFLNFFTFSTISRRSLALPLSLSLSLDYARKYTITHKYTLRQIHSEKFSKKNGHSFVLLQGWRWNQDQEEEEEKDRVFFFHFDKVLLTVQKEKQERGRQGFLFFLLLLFRAQDEERDQRVCTCDKEGQDQQDERGCGSD